MQSEKTEWKQILKMKKALEKSDTQFSASTYATLN